MTEFAKLYGGSLYDLARRKGWTSASWASWTKQ